MKDKTIPLLLKRIAEEYPSVPAQYSKNEQKEFEAVTYKELYENVLYFASGLLEIGCKRGDNIGLIADNRKEWFCISNAILSIGAADIPRGSDTTEQEISHIISFSGCKTAVLENITQVKKILQNIKEYPLLKTIIIIENAGKEELEDEINLYGVRYFNYQNILEIGKKAGIQKAEQELMKGSGNEIASIIFTSGTTGEPKGVMLTHTNFLKQLEYLPERVRLNPGESALSVLPVWHAFERACEYVILKLAGSIIYSKPIGSILLADMAAMNPVIFPSVPRIWEAVYDGIYKAMRKKSKFTYCLFNFFVKTGILWSKLSRNVSGKRPHFSKTSKIVNPAVSFLPFLLLYPLYFLGDLLIYRKIRNKLGNKFKAGVSGGGALPPYVDEFFWTVGINVIEGYGITEASPVVSVRYMDNPVFGTIGTPLKSFQVKIVDEKGNSLPKGIQGSLLLKGEGIMKGYYKKPELTAEVISEDGWFDTGDMAVMEIDGNLILKGRKKNTIVLRGGENIEPVPIEMKLQKSSLINTAVVLGQDQKYLAALIVIDQEELKNWASKNNLSGKSVSELLSEDSVQKLYKAEVGSLINSKSGFKSFELINKICLLENEFKVGEELSAKQEIMRHKINKIYAKQIDGLFKE